MPSPQAEQFKIRTKQFALRVLQVFLALPRRADAQILGKQLVRSGTSVGAQYREAVRSRSPAEFISKVESCQQELEETIYWIELIIEHRLLRPARLRQLLTEAGELQAILASSARTAKNARTVQQSAISNQQ